MSYFKVGEECILQSRAEPQLNGDCIVIEVLPSKRRAEHLLNGKTIISNGHAYFTTTKDPDGLPWSESALRKKHKPSTKSLSSMIEELNIKSKVESK
jgi:hypothetical protein